MEPTYYQPTIEEFHVGFEFKWQGYNVSIYDSNKTQNKVTLDIKHSLSHINTALENGHIRVKRLDREDIEACGWVLLKMEGGGNPYPVFKLGGFYMDFWFNNQTGQQITEIRDVEEIDSFDRSGEVFFNGEVKNKSELIKVMQMIGVK